MADSPTLQEAVELLRKLRPYMEWATRSESHDAATRELLAFLARCPEPKKEK